jgi:hypothetical protein
LRLRRLRNHCLGRCLADRLALESSREVILP